MDSEALLVIVSYNNLQLTAQSLQSIAYQDNRKTRAVVWDNASTDGTPAWLATAGVEFFASPENVLWSPAINRAIKKFWGGEPYIGFMNNDIVLPPCAVRRLTHLLRHPEIGAVGPMGSNLGGPQSWTRYFGSVDTVDWMGELHHRIKDQPPRRVTYLAGAMMMLRKKTWDKIGPLDESMPLGADDHDYAIRLKRAGFELWVCQNVYVQHYGHSSGTDPNWDVWGKKSWDAFQAKWNGVAYQTEEEANLKHWNGDYTEGYDG